MPDPTIHEPPDLALVACAKAGELNAFEALTKRLLDDALANLDEKHRLVFLLRDVEGTVDPAICE
jgi:DNA-directed RNA polymerase specialized sigma24 family protein